MKIVHFITGLGKGGAETMLTNILKYTQNSEYELIVISLGLSHYYEKQILSYGVPIYELNFKRNPFKSFLRCYRLLYKADILNCWMYHCNYIGYFLGKLAKCKKIIWNIRHSNLEPCYNHLTTLKVVDRCAKISKNIDLIAYNGERAKNVHEQHGFSGRQNIVLENGCDADFYKKKNEAVRDIKVKFQIPLDKQILLSVSKYHKIKDIPMFLDTFLLIKKQHPDIVALMCGSNISCDNESLVEDIKKRELSINKDIWLLGLRDDLPDIFSIADLYILHSAGEAFPNSLIQAMACECICLSTNVGDVANILNSSFIVDVKDSYRMAKKAMNLLNCDITEMKKIGESNRKVVLTRYDIKTVIKSYEYYLMSK